METIAIVGVGLIGGSFALALRKAGFAGTILGVSSPSTIREALAAGIVDRGLPLDEAVSQADLVYLSHPISKILDALKSIDASVRPGALVTDVGSTKAAIVRQASLTIRKGLFVGGHPMAGKEVRGVAAADPDLFRAKTYFLTPVDPADLDRPPVREFLGWLDRIGALPAPIAAAEHDRLVALTSHLPQLASTALAATLAGHLTPDQARTGAGPGLRDATRLALSPYEIWADILSTNHAAIGQALASYIEKLQQIRESLGTRETAEHFRKAEKFIFLLRKQSQ